MKEDPAVEQALHMAEALQMPLLITGEPGVGKSRVARYAAGLVQNRDQATRPERRLHKVTVRSDTRYQDLFYECDEIGRFHAANRRDPGKPGFNTDSSTDVLDATDARWFVRFHGLGAAILRQRGPGLNNLHDAREGLDLEQCPPSRPDVVLIDEIDKAPRDLPNDLLVQLEQWSFEVREFRHVDKQSSIFALDNDSPKPLVIITSNGERELPAAFLRRCVYLHMEMPGEKAQEEIVIEHILRNCHGAGGEKSLIEPALVNFNRLRTICAEANERKPGLAELLNWIEYLALHKGQPDDQNIMRKLLSKRGETDTVARLFDQKP